MPALKIIYNFIRRIFLLQKTFFDTKTIVRAAFFITLNIVLSRMLSIMITPQLKIGFSTLPLILAGLSCGPVIGAIVGVISDIIGIMINAQGQPHLGFTFSAMLSGLIPGLVAMYYIKDNHKRKLVGIIISVVIVFALIHVVLNTIWLSQILGKAVTVMLPLRAFKACVEGVLTIILCYSLYDFVMIKKSI